MKKKYMMAACACMSCVLLGSGTYVYARPETSVTNHFSLYHGSYKEELLCYKKAGTLLH